MLVFFILPLPLIIFGSTNEVRQLLQVKIGCLLIKQNIISALILGLLFTAIYYFTSNIWLSIILHSTIDISAGVLGYYANGLQKKTITEFRED